MIRTGEGFHLGNGTKELNISLSLDEEGPAWKEAVEPVIEDCYHQDGGQKGYSEQEIRSAGFYCRERMDYWEKQEVEEGIPLRGYFKNKLPDLRKEIYVSRGKRPKVATPIICGSVA